MGNITGYSQNKFKSADFLYSKINREFKSFSNANLLDDSDFPLYTAEVLKKLGISVFKEDHAVLKIKNGKAKLPLNYKEFYAAYKSFNTKQTNSGKHLQRKHVFEDDVTCELLHRTTNCDINCDCPDKVINKVTIKRYVNDDNVVYDYDKFVKLKLSPNVQTNLEKDENVNHLYSFRDEIKIENGCAFVNFDEGTVYLQYYGFPLDNKGLPMIPDIIEVEKAIEWYIKHQVLLNFWLVDDLTNAQNKWQKAEQEFEKWMGEARYILKLPAFATLVNSARNMRSLNKLEYFSTQDIRVY